MSNALLTGPNVVVKGVHFFEDILKGKQIVTTYEGTPDGIAGVVASLQNYERYETDISDPPKVTLTVTSPDTSESPVWELLTNLSQIKARQHPDYRSISLANLWKLDVWFMNGDASTSPGFTGTADEIALAQGLQLLEITEETFWREDVVLRFTVTISNASQTLAAYQNFDKLFTTAQLLDPSVSNLFIPAGIAASIAVANLVPVTTADTWMVWKWLKMKPTSRQTQIGKVVITGEYWLNLWNNKLYTAVP